MWSFIVHICFVFLFYSYLHIKLCSLNSDSSRASLRTPNVNQNVQHLKWYLDSRDLDATGCHTWDKNETLTLLITHLSCLTFWNLFENNHTEDIGYIIPLLLKYLCSKLYSSFEHFLDLLFSFIVYYFCMYPEIGVFIFMFLFLLFVCLNSLLPWYVDFMALIFVFECIT